MKSETLKLLDEHFRKYPVAKAESLPNDTEIEESQEILGCRFHSDYIEYLKLFGGGTVGSLIVYGLRPTELSGNVWYSVVKVTEHFRDQQWPHADESYVISEDGGGNPFGVTPDGRIMCYDHDVGDYREIAPDFEAFLLKQLSK